MIDNWRAIPRNSALCPLAACRANVFALSSINAVKYGSSYLFKGPDRATIRQDVTIAGEASASLRVAGGRRDERLPITFRFGAFRPLRQRGAQPPVVRPEVPLPGQVRMYFDPTRNVAPATERAARSTLTEWRRANAEYPERRRLLLSGSPSRFVRNATTKRRQRNFRFLRRAIRRAYVAHHIAGQQVYVLVLPIDVPGATSSEALRATPNGVLCNTFREAAALRGLSSDDPDWRNDLEGIATRAPAARLWELANISLFRYVGSPWDLRPKYRVEFADDFRVLLWCNVSLKPCFARAPSFP